MRNLINLFLGFSFLNRICSTLGFITQVAFLSLFAHTSNQKFMFDKMARSEFVPPFTGKLSGVIKFGFFIIGIEKLY